MYRIGVDLGGTNIAVGLVNEQFEIVAKESLPTQGTREGIEIAQDIAKLCLSVCKNAGVAMADVASVGVAAPGAVNDEAGVIIYTTNLKFENFPMSAFLREQIGVREIHVENDANAAAWAEAVAGAAKGSHSSVMITLGTGVGGGIVVDGKIFTGFNSVAGELGHMVIEVDGRPCTCGRCGCWETYSSATGLIKTTHEKLAECEQTGRKTLMTDLVAERGKVNGRTAFDATRMGDEAAREVVDCYIKYLASGIASLINILQPEVVSIGGGISNEGQFLLDLLLPAVKPQCYGAGRISSADIRIAQLRNDAGIIGAATLGM